MRSTRILKRTLDLAGAVFLLILFAPLLLLIAALIRLTMGAPIFFRQVRPGLHDRPFTLVKFRTMPVARDQTLSIPVEGNLPWAGRLLRLTSLDELPELFHVLRGDMSLVGPRPLLTEYLSFYQPEHLRRHHMPPGITGLAQINGRQTLKFSKRLELDVWYVDHWSLWLDLRILFKTAFSVFRRHETSDPAELAGVDDLGLCRAMKIK